MSRIITTVLAIGALLCSMLLSYTASISINPTQNIVTEAKNKPNTKKKAKLKLDYTHPKFATEINQDQQQAILKSLKKWKLDLPINNTFTITSWANLKTDTDDNSSQFKKKNKSTPNSIVVYMWASSNNSDWKVGKIPTVEESESGDPRFVRTEFNVLLKQGKNGKWKATIEQDNELKTESTEVVENQQDVQIHQDLFGTNREINKFTDTQEVVVDEDSCDNASSVSSSVSSNTSSVSISSSSVSNLSSSISSCSSSSSSQLSSIVSSSFSSSSYQSTNSSQSTNSVSSSVSVVSVPAQSSNSSTSSLISSNTSSIISQSSNNSNSTTTSFKSSWLNSILNFGSVQASAGEYDNSWFWTNGEKWSVGGYGWHELDKDYFNDGIKSPSLDFMPPTSYQTGSYNSLGNMKWNSIPILAPKTGTIIRAQDCPQNSTIAFADMRILHLAPNNYNGKNGVQYKKNQTLGYVANGYNSDGTFTDFPCGRSFGYPHIHVKFLAKGMIVDGTNINWDTDQLGNVTNGIGLPSGTILTSQNTPPSAATGFLKSLSDNNRLFDIYGGAANNQDKVVLWGYNGGYNNQRWTYNSGNQSFTTAVNNRCLDTGNVGDPNNRWLRMSDCSGNDNQKWLRGSDKTLRVKANLGLCLDSQSGNANGSTLYLNNCNGSSNQKFGMDDFTSMGFAEQNIVAPVATTPKFTFRLQGTNYCMDAYNPFNGRTVYTWDCNGSPTQRWDWVPTNRNNGSLLRSTNTNYCVDLYQASNGRSTYTWQCDPNANNHNWYYDQTSKTLRQMGTNQCLDAYNPYDGSAVYTWDCNGSPTQKWDNLYQGSW